MNTFQMTKEDYKSYQHAFGCFMSEQNISSLHRSAKCEESYVSSCKCDVCGDRQQGMRLDAVGADIDIYVVNEYVICEDCEYYAEYGRLDDVIMEAIGE